jgi:RNA recognition motif-containing protein
MFIRNVPPDATEQEITEIFKNCGVIKGIRLPLQKDNPTKKKGLCFIDFENKLGIKNAFELDGY